MRVFSIGGIIFLALYAAIIDQVLEKVPAIPYKSMVKVGGGTSFSLEGGGIKSIFSINALWGVGVLIAAVILVQMTPKILPF